MKDKPASRQCKHYRKNAWTMTLYDKDGQAYVVNPKHVQKIEVKV
jgi:hypothetical protein